MTAWLIACAFFLLVAFIFDRQPRLMREQIEKSRAARDQEADERRRAERALIEAAKQKPAGKRTFAHKGVSHNRYHTPGRNNQLTPWVRR